jgi:hypothetical protein
MCAAEDLNEQPFLKNLLAHSIFNDDDVAAEGNEEANKRR